MYWIWFFYNSFNAFWPDLTGAYQNASVYSKVWILKTCVYCICVFASLYYLFYKDLHISYGLFSLSVVFEEIVCVIHMRLLQTERNNCICTHVFLFLDRIVKKVSAWEAYNKPVFTIIKENVIHLDKIFVKN